MSDRPNSSCQVRALGRVEYGKALALQQRLVEQRKQALIADQLLLLEHPHTITLGRNGRMADAIVQTGTNLTFDHLDENLPFELTFASVSESS